jgi:transposase
MAVATADFAAWLGQADIPRRRLTPQVDALLRAAFRFRQRQGGDYYSTRLLGHFLLHCDSGLKVAQVARLLGISRPTASAQQGIPSKEVIRRTHHRLRGRPYGKLLPRFAGAIAGFLLEHQGASRAQLLDFIDGTFGVRVSRVALYKFLKKFGLDQIAERTKGPAAAAQDTPALGPPLPPAVAAGASADSPGPALSPGGSAPAGALLPGPALVPPPPFSSPGRSTPAPSC